ncbi:MAG: LuxR C-terminal-related transcriptional regulator [Collinsella sp.]
MATVVVCWSVPMFVTHIALAHSVENERPSWSTVRMGSPKRLACASWLAYIALLSDVQSQILLMTAEGATTKTIAEDVGYAASTVQALRSASYRS